MFVRILKLSIKKKILGKKFSFDINSCMIGTHNPLSFCLDPLHCYRPCNDLEFVVSWSCRSLNTSNLIVFTGRSVVRPSEKKACVCGFEILIAPNFYMESKTLSSKWISAKLEKLAGNSWKITWQNKFKKLL